MALTAPVPTINGSQTEFSKVWIRGSTATSTLPNLRFYKADGRIVHPVAAALNITIVHTAADTLYNRIQAAITAADATKNAAWVAKWFGKHQIVGVTSDAITGDTLLVNRAETTGITASNDEPTARVAADFFAQEQYAVASRFKHGIIPGDQSGMDGATVTVDGDVLTSASYKTFVSTEQALSSTTASATFQVTCQGYAQLIIDPYQSGTSATYSVQVSNNGADWRCPRYHTETANSPLTLSGTSATYTFVNATRLVVEVAGYKYFRLIRTGGSGTDNLFTYSLTAAPYAQPAPLITSAGAATIAGVAAHDAVVSGNPVLIAGEARTADGTAVASGDVARLMLTALGKLVNRPYALAGHTWQYAGPTGGITDTDDDAIASAGGAGVRNYITALQVVNMSTTATEVVVKDGSTVIWRCELDADGGASGISVNFPTPLRGTAATALNVACLTTAAKVYVNAQGYTSAD